MERVESRSKCHLLVFGYKNENDWANIGNEKIWESNEQKLLGLVIDMYLLCVEKQAISYLF